MKDGKINFNPEKAYNLLAGKFEDWLAAAIKMLPNFVVAIIIVVVFALLAKLVKRIFNNIMGRVTDNASLQGLLSSIIYVVIVAIGTFIALSVLKLDGAVTSLLAGAGVIGLALGFAFQDIASNFIAGAMMSIRKPFQEGDLIETNDFFGNVLKIHLRTTNMLTLDGQHVMIPNAEVFKKPITNYTRHKRRRIDLPVGVHYKTDLKLAKNLAVEAVKALDDIADDDVSCFYSEFGDSSINFIIRFWIEFGNSQAIYMSKRDEAIIAIKKAFDENGITIPFPMRTLDLGDVNFKDIFGSYQQSKGS